MRPDDRLLLPPAEAARRLSMSESKFRRLVRQGQIRGVRPSPDAPRGDLLIPTAELERYVGDLVALAAPATTLRSLAGTACRLRPTATDARAVLADMRRAQRGR